MRWSIGIRHLGFDTGRSDMNRAILAMTCVVVQIAAAGQVEGAVVVGWGFDNHGQVSNTPAGSDFVAIAGGAFHSLALTSDGSIVSWGDDTYGVVRNTPAGSGFVAIAAGGFHSLALTSDGSIVSWGNDDYGQVNNTPADSDFIVIAGGLYHSLALTSDGSIVSWGDDTFGKVSNTPTDNDFLAIAGRGHHSIALLDVSTVPEPTSLGIWGLGAAVIVFGAARRPRAKRVT